MNNVRMSILNLNQYCLLEILKYIIADCEMKGQCQKNLMNYANVVNFALANKYFEAMLEDYHKDLYNSLQFVFVTQNDILKIDFSELQTTHKGKNADAFWRIYGNAIRQNKVLREVSLYHTPESFQPDFLNNFEIIKRDLENKKNLQDVTIRINGYSLEDLNNFDHLEFLKLDVRMSAEALVNVCKSNPHLITLDFHSTEILGRLSDIVPHCSNLRCLRFVAKPDIDAAEYAPLTELPSLRELTIYKAFENGLLLNIFEAIKKWKRPGLEPLQIHFKELLPHLSIVTIARINSLLCLELKDDPKGIALKTTYFFSEISTDSCPLEQSLATITMIKADLKITAKKLCLCKWMASDIDRSGFISLLKAFNINTLELDVRGDTPPIANVLASMRPDESYALKSVNTICVNLDRFDTSELVKIKSITTMFCRFSDWESVELLSALINLETVFIVVDNEFEKTYSKALCSLLNTCSLGGIIQFADSFIEFTKNENTLSNNKRYEFLKISGDGQDVFEAFIYSDLITIEKLDVSEYSQINIKNILKLAEVKPFKKLIISLINVKGIEHLSSLTELEELFICDSARGSLINLFDQLATKASNSLKCLKIKSEDLSTEEIVRVFRIRSLKKLFLGPNNASLKELANSNIEELSITFSHFICDSLFASFDVEIKNSFQDLESGQRMYKFLHLRKMGAIFETKSYTKRLQYRCLCKKSNVYKKLYKNNENVCVSTDNVINDNNLDGLDFLADLQNLNKLQLYYDIGDSLPNVYHALASKNVKLTHLSATIRCTDELNEITRIKSLRKLNLFIESFEKNLTSFGELSDLESLQIYAWRAKYDEIMDIVLPILKCCRNIDRLIVHQFMGPYNINLDGFHETLKSVRDPSHQDPLTVIVTRLDCVHEYKIIRENLVLHFENDYFKILTSLE